MLAREGIFRILITTKNFRALRILLSSFSTILFQGLNSTFSSQVMEKLVDIVQFLHLEIHNTFGRADSEEPQEPTIKHYNRLGPAGLALHYANIINQIDNLVSVHTLLETY
jgi:hypothetical protein